MSHRLSSGGRFIDRNAPVTFTFNGTSFSGFKGDTLASALLGTGQVLMGRSFKYHRPRGVVASGAEEPNALVGLGTGDAFEPNARATTTELFDGLTAEPQNCWPSLERDVGSVNSYLSSFLTAGFYYKMFIHPRPFWKHIYEPFIRKSAGLGKSPDFEARDPDRYEYFYAHVDLLIIGGGVAGLMAAKTAATSGKKVLLIEQTAFWGGRAPVDGGEIDGMPAQDWIYQTVADLSAMENVELRTRMMGAGVYDHGYATGYERLTDHAPDIAGPRHRLWRIRAGHIITATGAIERPLSFAGNDVPGVMLASAVRDYITNWGVAPGKSIVVVANNDDGYLTALSAKNAGLDTVVVDARADGGGALMQEAVALGIRVIPDCGISKVKGKKTVTGVAICRQSGSGAVVEEIKCDCVAMAGGWSPVVHLWSHCGGKLTWDEAQSAFRPDPTRAPTGADGQSFVTVAGTANGEMALGDVLADGAKAGQLALGVDVVIDVPQAVSPAYAPMKPVWLMPENATYELRSKAWLDYQNDVKVSDVQLAACEGYESVEHTKRYTTLGMATDQGKLSNINGLALLSDALDQEIPATGTTTFRPPYTPISMGAIAGEARGEIFQPIRQTPMHDWHVAQDAFFEPVGQWRRPFCYPKAGESHLDAINREILNARENVSLLDASTLGKIIVKGPDAGKLLDMIYTNKMSTLKPGKCRYGLVCNENGFLSDDGVVACLDEDTFLCHTTSGGADAVHASMEDWLQCEWWDWQAYTANVTEQYAQIAVVGPKARDLLNRLGGMDLSKEALPFMGWAEGELAGFPVRIYRISFSGELSYEISVPANQGRALWDLLLETGADMGIAPYGTEAMHVLRAEKGFIIVGDESDGTVTPHDLGMSWAVSKKKDDFLGKRALERSFLTAEDRWQLVGLEALNKSVLPDGIYAVEAGRNANGQRKTQGRVTSSYYSPTLNQGIALGLVKNGPERMGEVLEFVKDDGQTTIHARIVSPVFYDPEGEKQNV